MHLHTGWKVRYGPILLMKRLLHISAARSSFQGPRSTPHNSLWKSGNSFGSKPRPISLKEKPILEKPMDFVTLWYNKDSYWVQVWPSEARVPKKASYKDMALLKLRNRRYLGEGEVNVARGDLPLSLLCGTAIGWMSNYFPFPYIGRWWLLIFSS